MLTLEQVASWVRRNTLGRTGRQVLDGDLVVTGNVQTSSGPFTPAISADTPGTLAISYTTRLGRYHRIGKLVFYNLVIAVNTFTLGTASGSLIVTGLPFASANYSGEAYLGEAYVSGVAVPVSATGVNLVSLIQPATTHAHIYSIYYNAAPEATLISGLAAGDGIRMTGLYLTD